MTDEDVVTRFCRLVDVSYHYQAPRAAHWKPTFIAHVYGKKAITLIEAVRPYMGKRRQLRIEELLTRHAEIIKERQAREAETAKRLPIEKFRERWLNRKPSESLAGVAREFGVHPQSLKNQLVRLGIYQT